MVVNANPKPPPGVFEPVSRHTELAQPVGLLTTMVTGDSAAQIEPSESRNGLAAGEDCTVPAESILPNWIGALVIDIVNGDEAITPDTNTVPLVSAWAGTKVPRDRNSAPTILHNRTNRVPNSASPHTPRSTKEPGCATKTKTAAPFWRQPPPAQNEEHAWSYDALTEMPRNNE